MKNRVGFLVCLVLLIINGCHGDEDESPTTTTTRSTGEEDDIPVTTGRVQIDVEEEVGVTTELSLIQENNEGEDTEDYVIEDITEDFRNEEPPHCIMYGHSSIPSPLDTTRTLNSYVTTPPQPLDEDSLHTLALYCPEVVNANTSLCCNAEQVIDLVSNLALPQTIIGRCPACWHNFRKAFCELSCSPRQSEFMRVTKGVREKKGGNNNETAILSLTTSISERYVTATYESCRSVLMSSTNGPAMDFLCGPWGAYRCDPTKWFDYMGSTSNGFSPFDIIYEYTNDTKALDAPTFSCGEEVGGRKCACVDCEEACPAAVVIDVHDAGEWMLWGCSGVVLVMTAVAVMGVVLIVTTAIILREDDGDGNGNNEERRRLLLTRKRNRNNYTDSNYYDEQNILVTTKPSYDTGHKTILTRMFALIGTFSSTHPFLTLIPCILFVVAASFGISNLMITTNPVELWASPSSRSRQEKDFFDRHFEPFYRTSQIIITNGNPDVVQHTTSDGLETFGPVFQKPFLHDLIDLINDVKALRSPKNNVTLSDVCFKPLSPRNDECVIFSLTSYWQDDVDNIELTRDHDNYLDHFKFCSRNPASPKDSTQLHLSCLGRYGGPVDPNLVIGNNNWTYGNSSTAILTFVINNHYGNGTNDKAMEWELEFIKYMMEYREKKAKESNYTVAFNSERSIEDELSRESHGEVVTVTVSYAVMFAYIALSLRNFSFKSCLSDSSLALAGILIVLTSVSSSIGIFGYLGVPATLIIIEVIPFLVLAVGVDNIFILVQTYERKRRDVGVTIGTVVGEVGPSMLLSTISESVCFFLGGILSGMPAVRTFAFYAAVALVLDFLLQITAFVALMGVEETMRRKKEKEAGEQDDAPKESLLFRTFRNFYAPLVMKFRVPIVVLFFLYFCLNVVMVTKIDIGLEQQLSMPEDSYVLEYFKAMAQYLSVGPPVYFVLSSPHNFSYHQNEAMITSSHPASLVSQIFASSRAPNASFIAKPAASWLDDFYDWAGNENCCKKHRGDGSFCPNTSGGKQGCEACHIHVDEETGRIKDEEEFERYMGFFLKDNPTEECPKGGHAAYGQAVDYSRNTTFFDIKASYFMTYHTVLKTSEDYTLALKSARIIADNITRTLNTHIGQNDVQVFPYSIFYVFYEQYLTMWEDTLTSVGMSLLAIATVVFILTGFDLRSALIVTLTIMMIIVDLGGLMYMWGISMNAISLVNIVMATGISVEFCTHIMHAYKISVDDNRVDKASSALVTMGSSVLSGITLTKFGGIVVLGFAKSQIFRVFYFRMYMGIVVLGAAHGLLWLPALMAVVGGK